MNYREQLRGYQTGGTITTPQGKQLSDFREGGLVRGQSHSQGGVPTYQMGGEMPMGEEPEQIAEVEGNGVSPDGIAVDGGERIFSIEDTQQMEGMAQQIASIQDPAQQQQMAAELGMFVVQAITKQEQVNPSEGTPEAPMGGEAGGMPPEMGGQPMMAKGGKFNYKQALNSFFSDSEVDNFYK